MNPSYIVAPLDRLNFGIKDKHKDWWGFDRMIETWKILDKHPKTPLKELPLYTQSVEVSEKIFNVKPTENTVIGVRNHRDMYFDIRDNGFDEEKAPIEVRIRKNGVIHIGNGHHRVSMLKHLKYSEIKVKVVGRHREFLAFKKGLYRLYGKKFLYQPVDHPDFADWAVNQNGHNEVLQLITENMQIKDKNILDIGCCTGAFSYKLSKLGGNVTGIDRNAERIRLAEYQRTYREAQKSNPRFLAQSFESHLVAHPHYDVTLLLNVIHHYLRKDVKKTFRELANISKHTEAMVVQLDTKIPLLIKTFKRKMINKTEFTSHRTYVLPNHSNRPVIFFKKEAR